MWGVVPPVRAWVFRMSRDMLLIQLNKVEHSYSSRVLHSDYHAELYAAVGKRSFLEHLTCSFL
jgi:hypothetical protein